MKRVGFDTFDNKDASDFSLTLKAKHKDYNYTRRSRTFLCGTDQNEYSEFALEWLIDELVDDGDEVVCLRVVDKDSKMSSDSSIQERVYRQEARKLLNEIIKKNDEDKAISIVLEFSVGKVHDTIQRMVHIYEPVILIVGTRGRSLGGIQGLLPGSVSKYCLQHSPVPVIVVRPSNKREKKKKKRQADPARRAYMDILERSNDPSLTNIAQHGNHSITRISVSTVTSNASGSSIAEGSTGGSGARDSLERVTEGVASTEFSRESVMSSSKGVAVGLGLGSVDISPKSSSPPVLATPADQSSPESPLESKTVESTER